MIVLFMYVSIGSVSHFFQDVSFSFVSTTVFGLVVLDF